MQSETEDRYASAKILADDVERYLADEPVNSYREPITARAARWGRKHKAIVSGAVVLLITSVIALSVSNVVIAKARDETTLQKELAESSEERAEARREEAETANAAAQISYEQTKAAMEFLARDIIGGIHRRNNRNPNITLREALDRAAAHVGEAFVDKPLSEATVRRSISSAYQSLAIYKDAKTHAELALKLYRRHLGQEHPQTLTLMSFLTDLLKNLGKYDEVLKLNREILEMKKRVFGKEHPQTLITMNDIAIVLNRQQKYAKAQNLFEETLDLRRRILGPEHLSTIRTMIGLANAFKHQGMYAQARILNEETLRVRQRILGPEHRSTIGSMNNLVLLLQREGKYVEAQKLLEDTLEIMRRALAPNDPYTLGVEINMAIVLVDQGKYEEARLANEKNLKRMLDALGPNHPGTIMSMSNLAWILATHPDGKFHDQKKAMEYSKKAVEVMPEEGEYWNTLGIVHYKSGDMQSAIETLEKSMELRSGGDANEWLFLAMAEWRLNHKDKARKWYDKSLKWMNSRKPNNPNLIRFRDEAAGLLEMPILAPRPKSLKNNYRNTTAE